nr:hypothetical protein [Neomicrococcus aestuarii]
MSTLQFGGLAKTTVIVPRRERRSLAPAPWCALVLDELTRNSCATSTCSLLRKFCMATSNKTFTGL